MQFTDKFVLITLPAKGMGHAIALAFAREGARLSLAGRDTEAIEAVADEARATGCDARVYRADTSAIEMGLGEGRRTDCDYERSQCDRVSRACPLWHVEDEA